MAILGLVAMVVVVVVVKDFVAGNRAHKFAGLFALGGAKHPLSNFLCMLFLLDLSLDLLVGGFFLVNWIGFGQNGLFSSFFSSSYASIFFRRDANSFICLLQGLQVLDSDVWSFLSMWIPWTILTICLMSVVSIGRVHQRNPKMKSQVGFKSQAIVCKNIYIGFIQFLLEDHW